MTSRFTVPILAMLLNWPTASAQMPIPFAAWNLPAPLTLTVNHAYPTNGAAWMSYVKGNNGGTTVYNQPDTACAGTETGGYGVGCIHGGEILVVTATGKSSCNNLSMTDALGAFNWVCDSSTSPVKFYSTGLLQGKALADLINATSWKNNSVTLKAGSSTIGTSASAAWWTNTISALTDNSAGVYIDLNTSGNIYTLSASRTTAGYRIAANRVGVVIFGGAVLKHNGDLTNNCSNGGPFTAICTLTVYGSNFSWIEGAFDGNQTASYTVLMETSQYSRLINVKASAGGGGATIYSWAMKNSLVTGMIAVNDSGGSGLTLAGSSNANTIKNLRTGNSVNGVQVNASTTNNFIGLLSVGSTNGVYLTGGANNNTFLDSTIASNTTGISYNGANDANNFINLNVVNNGTGLNLYNAVTAPNNNKFRNIATASNGTNIDLGKSSNNTFSGYLIMGNNTSTCTNGTGTSPGLTVTTCAAADASTSTLVTGVTTSGSFYGALSTNDVANTSDTNGSATFAYALDFYNYDNPFRIFANGAAATLTAAVRGFSTSGTTRIWDFSVSAGNTILLNRSGDGTSANSAFADGAACPSEIGGNQTFTDSNSKTFLLNAMEVLGTGGNSNGLCESGERCIYTPNVGAYQGSGNYLGSKCTFSNGTVTGVTMYAYPSNGL